MLLQRLTSPTGNVVVRQEDPEINIARNVVYLPFKSEPKANWGLFDNKGLLVPDSYDFREDSARPSYQAVSSLDGLALPPLQVADKTYFYCGNFAPHYGHFLINTLPRLWALPQDGSCIPPLLFHGPAGLETWPGLRIYREILQRLGLIFEELQFFDQPIRLPEVIVPASSFQEENFVHTAFGRLCDRIVSGLYQPDEVGCESRPVYLSKTRLQNGVRRFANEEALEEKLARSGIDIVYPEEMSFSEQVRLFATRQTIIGSIGSALHTAMFAPSGRQIIVLCPTPNFSATYALIDALKNHQAFYYSTNTHLSTVDSRFHLNFTLQDPQGVAEAILRRLDHCGDVDQYDLTSKQPNSRLSLRIPSLPVWAGRFSKAWTHLRRR